MKKVVGLGACVVDTLISCNEYPKEDTKYKAEEIYKVCGGPVSNALVVMSKFGVNTEVVGAFADDDGGRFILSDFKKHGVGTSNTVTVKEATSFTSYIVLSKEKGTRTCVFDRGSVLDDPCNINFSAFNGADVLHLDGNYLESAIAAAKYSRENGIKVSLDAGGLYKGIEDLLPLVDILIPSAEFAMGITGANTPEAAILELYKKYEPEVIAVTDGANGGYYVGEGKVYHYDSFKITTVDTNGAGDTFHGAFIAAYLDGKSIAECCKFSSATSAYKCMRKGARDYALSKDIITEFITKNS